jgi:Rap guanine nucleotide exchange factor 2
MYSNPMALTAYATELPFRQSVIKIPSERTAQDLTIINAYLKHLEALSSLRESHIRNLCKTIRYEIHDTHRVLFSRGELNTCWYILLSGSVFIESTMYLPRASFGKRTPSNQYRINECVVLEPSEMLVIDYPELDHVVQNHESLKRIGSKHNRQREQAIAPIEEQESNIMDSDTTITFHRKKSATNGRRSFTATTINDIPSSMTRSSHSRASDTSSAYSGSDVMQSSTNGDDGLMINNGENNLGQNDDGGLSRCISVHESDDESETSSEHSFPIHDHIRESLMKEANDRTDDDIEAILEFLLHFPAFANLTLHVRRELCKVLVYAQVEKAQTIVMNDGERYDSWSVIINGIVDDETTDEQLIRTLTVGQSFGCGPTLDQYCHTGIMKTRVDDCQFVVVAQNDYYAILNQGEKNIRKIEEDEKIVMIKEIRITDDEQHIPREIVIKATTSKLLDLLVDEGQLIDDPNYVQDFLLTYRTFIDDPVKVTNKLLEFFDENIHSMSCEHIARVVLSWVNNHYNDFETNSKLYEFLEIFDDRLQNHETEQIRSWRYLINLACFTKASIRNVTITRSTRDDVLNFNILGGSDTLANNGIYVSKVEKNSKAYEAGLRRGDQILNVNGQGFDYLTHVRALEILRGTTHLSITVKNNLMGLNEIVNPERSPNRKKRHDVSSYEQEIRNKLSGISPVRSISMTPTFPSNSPSGSHSSEYSSSSMNQSRPPLSAITPTKTNLSTGYSEKTKPRPLTKRMGFKRAVMQKLKITKTNR